MNAWAEQLATRLTEGSKRTYHAKERNLDEFVDFRYEPRFEAFKNAYQGWCDLDEDLLSESLFFSLAHLLEAKSDLDCAIELLATYYYRQAFVSLRTFIEDVLLPVYFMMDPAAYSNWKAGSGRVPNIRGKDGVIAFLNAKKVVEGDSLATLDTLYDSLNRYVHGRPDTLIHRGTQSGEWRGHFFKRSECLEWIDSASTCITSAIVITRAHSDQWLGMRKRGGIICSVCHGADFDKTIQQVRSEQVIYKYQCKKCNSVQLRSEPAQTPTANA